jgi:hypothetical protein
MDMSATRELGESGAIQKTRKIKHHIGELRADPYGPASRLMRYSQS